MLRLSFFLPLCPRRRFRQTARRLWLESLALWTLGLLAVGCLPPQLSVQQWGENIHCGLAAMRGLFLLQLVLIVVRLWPHFPALGRRLRAYMFTPQPPAALAVLRIATFGLLFGVSLYLFLTPATFSDVWGSRPAGSRSALPYMGWYVLNVPVSRWLLQAALGGLAVCSLFSATGWFTRYAQWGAAVLLFYVLGVPNFFGKINHTHYFLWLVWTLALSPGTARRFSIDAWRNPALRYVAPSWRYGFPLQMIALFLGIAYFFPGFWKLWNSGYAYVFGDNLRLQLAMKLSEIPDQLPLVDILGYPFLGKLGGAAVILFEMGFVFCLFTPLSRKIAVSAGVFFHLCVLLTMRINFLGILVMYLVFLPFHRWLPAPQDKTPPERARKPFSQAWVAALALWAGVNILFGLGKINSWPASCFPVFDYNVPNAIRLVRLQAADAHGKPIDLTLPYEKTRRYYPPSMLRQLEFRALAAYDAADTAALRKELTQLRQIWFEANPNAFAPQTRWRAAIEYAPLLPEDSVEARQGALIYQFPLPEK